MSNPDTMDRKAYLTLGMMFGVAAGTVVGMLMAPRSGQQSREILRSRADEARRKAKEQMDSQRDKAATVLQKAADKSAIVADQAQDKVHETSRQIKAEAERNRSERRP